MITILIVESDLKFVKNIITNIIKKNEKMRLIDISTTTEEAIDIITNYKPHIAIINTDIVDIDKIIKLKYKIPFVAITENPIKSAIKKYILKNNNITEVEKLLNKTLAETDFKRTKEYLISEFKKLKFNFSLLGTNYLIECIMYVYEKKDDCLTDKIEKKLYPIIAKQHDIPPTHIKWSIIKSINDMYDKNYEENTVQELCDFFYISMHYKPTAKAVIGTFISKLDF